MSCPACGCPGLSTWTEPDNEPPEPFNPYQWLAQKPPRGDLFVSWCNHCGYSAEGHGRTIEKESFPPEERLKKALENKWWK